MEDRVTLVSEILGSSPARNRTKKIFSRQLDRSKYQSIELKRDDSFAGKTRMQISERKNTDEKKVELVIKVGLFRRDAVILHPCRNFFTPITPKKRTDAIHGLHAEAN